MSRWRPATGERASPYITAAGHAALKREYEQLWGVRRPAVVRALSAAAAEGDRSENAEYQYRKKELREIDRRVRYLQKRLPVLRVVTEAPADAGRVHFGATVTYVDDAGRETRVRIVGADEADPAGGRISVDSPVARVLIGRRVDDEVTIDLPGGERHLCVLSVSYAEPG